jgi:hypothetical protein
MSWLLSHFLSSITLLLRPYLLNVVSGSHSISINVLNRTMSTESIRFVFRDLSFVWQGHVKDTYIIFQLHAHSSSSKDPNSNRHKKSQTGDTLICKPCDSATYSKGHILAQCISDSILETLKCTGVVIPVHRASH